MSAAPNRYQMGYTDPRAMLGASNTASSAVFKNSFNAPGGFVSDMNSVTTADLDSIAFNTPIETLVNIWVTRYGEEWVDVDRLMGDPFFGAAYKRLKSLGQLETHYLTDRSRFVCRKPT